MRVQTAGPLRDVKEGSLVSVCVEKVHYVTYFCCAIANGGNRKRFSFAFDMSGVALLLLSDRLALHHLTFMHSG